MDVVKYLLLQLKNFRNYYKEWSSYNSEDIAVYVVSSTVLYQQLTTLITSSSQTSKLISRIAQPLVTENITLKQVVSTSATINYRWGIILTIGILVGTMGSTEVLRIINRTKAEK